jgi:uncharacterized LabA/DUF88 family protein
MDIITAILVDGGFYRKRSRYLFGTKTAEERADELYRYCMAHLSKGSPNRHLYRIFYYDCPPIEDTLMHPLKGPVHFDQSETYRWTIAFFAALRKKRKVAIRLGKLDRKSSAFRLKQEKLRDLCQKKITVDQLSDLDFEPDFTQKGVDMRIGLDIASLAYKHLVNQIILISGDSDFVPAAKLARREGIDFILDPMWATNVSDDLREHIDGLVSPWPNPKKEFPSGSKS